MHDTNNQATSMVSTNFRFFIRFELYLLFILGESPIFYSDVILAQKTNDFRCSHVPPALEPASHVWLNDTNFSALNHGFEIGVGFNDNTEESQRRSGANKIKRHINHRRDFSYLESSAHDSMRDLLNRLEQPNLFDKDDLVPMRIQVHYDNSVYSLEQKKLEMIIDTVMPSVVKFFESVLSIRRDFTIDRFRISRRCPNNTIYYARDIIGLSRPYCMDRCEDYAICGEMVVPQAHLSACSYCNSTSKKCITNYASEGKGVLNTQLLLYVSAKQTARCRKDQTIAYAAHCAQDAKTDRPVAGHANLCPSSISTDTKDLKALIATVKHELTHVLGFSVSLFAYYRDEFGHPLTERDSNPGPIPIDPTNGYAKWSDKIIKKFVRTDWVTGEGKVDKEVHLFVTPTVVMEVRNHFNCSTLEGAELEDQGSDGTSMTHWEKRLFENEAMTGTHTQNSVYSRLTLAVLQDTGWYIANFTRAEKLEWGKDLGCDFAKKSCKSWIDERRAMSMSIRPFCDRVKGDLLQVACTEDRTSKAVCNMKQYKDPLPLAYQNFDYLDGVPKESLAYYGGSVDLADYCPFIQEFTWQAQNVTIRGSRCDLGGTNLESERNAALEYYGPQTKCFEHGRRWEQRSCVYKRHWHHYGAGCYKYSCSSGHVTIMVGNYSYPCYYTDQLVNIELLVDQWLYNGTLVCPACEKICAANKCRSYDKRVIDKILTSNQELTMTTDTNAEDTLITFINEALNSIDTKNNPDINLKSIIKQKSIDLESNKTIETKLKDHSKYKDYLLRVFTQHNKLPRHILLCSSANSSIKYSYTTMLILGVSFIIPFLTHDRPIIYQNRI